MFKLGKKIQRINLGSIVSPSMIPSQEQVSYSSRSPNDIMASTMLLVTVCVFSQSELSTVSGEKIYLPTRFYGSSKFLATNGETKSWRRSTGTVVRLKIREGQLLFSELVDDLLDLANPWSWV